MKNEINAVLENMTAATPEPEDYTGEDGLLYCGKCRKPKEAYFAPDKAAIFGRDRHPAECDCQVEPQQLADVGIVVHNEYLFVCHVSVPPLSSQKPAPHGHRLRSRV